MTACAELWRIRRTPILFSLASLLVLITALLAFPSNSHGAMPDRILATVNDEVITLTDYRLLLKQIGLPDTGDVVDEGLLKKLIEEKVILYEAKRRGIEASEGEVDSVMGKMSAENAFSRDEMEKTLQGEGVSVQGFRKMVKEKLTALKLVEDEVDSRVRVNEKEIEDYYHANKRDYPESPGKAEVRAIFLKLNEGATAGEITDLKRKALRIMDELREGVSFELLVVQYNDVYLRNNGGRLGEFEKGELIPLLDNKVFSISVGETSDPIWLKEGMYILKVVNKTPETFKSVEEVKEGIRAYLSAEKREALLHEWIKTLWERTSIKLQ